MEHLKEAASEFKRLRKIASKQAGYIAHDDRFGEQLLDEATDIIKGVTALSEAEKIQRLKAISNTLRDIIKTNVPGAILKDLGDL